MATERGNVGDMATITIEGVLHEIDQRSQSEYRIVIRDKVRIAIMWVDAETAARLSRLMFRRVIVQIKGDPGSDTCFPPPSEADEGVPF